MNINQEKFNYIKSRGFKFFDENDYYDESVGSYTLYTYTNTRAVTSAGLGVYDNDSTKLIVCLHSNYNEFIKIKNIAKSRGYKFIGQEKEGSYYMKETFQKGNRMLVLITQEGMFTYSISLTESKYIKEQPAKKTTTATRRTSTARRKR